MEHRRFPNQGWFHPKDAVPIICINCLDIKLVRNVTLNYKVVKCLRCKKMNYWMMPFERYMLYSSKISGFSAKHNSLRILEKTHKGR